MDNQFSTRLDGKNIVVTGASSGIGAATAKRASELGAQVIVHFHKNQTGADATVAEIKSSGGQASSIRADLRVEEDRVTLVAEAWKRLNRVDSWVNNAGADVLTGEGEKLSFEEKLELLWQVDVQSTTILTRLVSQRLRSQAIEQTQPSMVFIGWDQAPHGMDGDAGQMFGSIKSAVMSLANSYAQELAPDVRVNCVAPGWIQTAWGDQTSEAWDRRAKRSSLLRRWGKPEDVAAVITFLCSPAASFVNGQTIEINGGWNRQPRLD